jgi:hypothetical protein
MSGTYDLGGGRLGVRTTSARFGEALDRALARYRVEDDEPATYSIVLHGGANGERRSGRGFHILYGGTTALVRTLELTTLVRSLLTELEAATFAARNDSIHVRAALLLAGGRTVLAPWWIAPYLGDLGRRVERAGLKLPGTTWLAVDRSSGRVVPTELRLGIDEGPLRALVDDSAALDRHFVEEPTTVDVVCTFVEGDTFLQPLTRGLTLHRLAPAVGNIDEIRGVAIEGLGRLVSQAKCVGIGMSSPQRMLETLRLAVYGSSRQEVPVIHS